jgi:Domain of Unknown Function (DUF1080)
MRWLLLLALLTVNGLSLADDKKKDDDWTPLFNGKDLDGWTPKIKGYKLGDNFGDTFTVKDGVIKVDYSKYDKFDKRFGHLFYKESYSHYRLRIEYRFLGEQCKGGEGWATRNSGVMIHGQDPATMDKDQDFPVSIEVQFLGGLGKGARPTGNLCTPGTNVEMNDKLHTTHCTNSKSKTIDGDDWVTVEVEVNGSGVIKHLVNGDEVIEYSKPQYDPKDADAKKLIKDPKNLLIEKGTISLQSESHPIEFRKVEIKVLKK